MLSSLTVLIPAYNEAGNLPLLLPMLYEVLTQITDKFEILLINDGSSDNTKEISLKLEQNYPNLTMIYNVKNLGYGACLRQGIEKAKGDYFTLIPANLKFKPEELKILVSAIPGYDAVLGYRTKRPDNLKRKLFTYLFKMTIKVFFKINFKDIHWVKLYHTAILKNLKLKSNGIAIETEITLKLLQKHKKFNEVPIGYFPRLTGKSSADTLSSVLTLFKELILLKLAK